MRHPVLYKRLGYTFGEMTFYLLPHAGQDYLPKKQGHTDPVVAFDGGTVTLVTKTPTCGRRVEIDNGKGYKARYCHLSMVTVSEGQKVKWGQKVGLMGNTGLSRGVHLHFVLWKNGKLVDPLKYLSDSKTVDKEVVTSLFKQIWHRDPAKGEVLYFITRYNKEKWDRERLINTLKYWYLQVYPKGNYSKTGDAKWQRAKEKVL